MVWKEIFEWDFGMRVGNRNIDTCAEVGVRGLEMC